MTGFIERDTAVLERERARFEEIAGAHRDDALQLERLEQELSEAQAESESLDKEEKRLRYLALELRAFLREFYVRPASTLSRCADSWERLLERDIKALREIGAGLPDQKRSQIVSLDRNSVVREYNVLLERHNALNQKLSQVQQALKNESARANELQEQLQASEQHAMMAVEELGVALQKLEDLSSRA